MLQHFAKNDVPALLECVCIHWHTSIYLTMHMCTITRGVQILCLDVYIQQMRTHTHTYMHARTFRENRGTLALFWIMYVCVGAYVRAGVCISTDSSVSVWFRNFGRLLTFDQQVLDDQMEEMHGLLLGCNAKKWVVMREVGV